MGPDLLFEEPEALPGEVRIEAAQQRRQDEGSVAAEPVDHLDGLLRMQHLVGAAAPQVIRIHAAREGAGGPPVGLDRPVAVGLHDMGRMRRNLGPIPFRVPADVRIDGSEGFERFAWIGLAEREALRAVDVPVLPAWRVVAVGDAGSPLGDRLVRTA